MRLAQGRTYLIRLPNIAAAPLTDAEVAELLTWLVRRFDAAELPPDFVPFTADEVARSRRAPLVDVEAARQAVLDELARAPAAAKTGS